MFGKETDFSAIMKGSLRFAFIYLFMFSKIPILGYVVQDLNMCLLDRNWETDQAHFRTFLERFTTHPCGECVFLCPEGTTRTAKNISKSKAFATKTNRPQFDVSVVLNQENCEDPFSTFVYY